MPMSPADHSARFEGGCKREVCISPFLRDLVELDIARNFEDFRTRFFVPEWLRHCQIFFVNFQIVTIFFRNPKRIRRRVRYKLIC